MKCVYDETYTVLNLKTGAILQISGVSILDVPKVEFKKFLAQYSYLLTDKKYGWTIQRKWREKDC